MMASAWGSSWGSAWGNSWGSIATPDTHDGFDEDSYRRAKEEQARKAREFKSARERLRELLEGAWREEFPGPVAAEVKAIAAPHVERLESGVLRIDYAALQRHRRELLAFHDALRSEYQVRMALEQDDEDVMILAIWN